MAIRTTQEIVEVVLGPSPNVQVTQEVLEIVIDTSVIPSITGSGGVRTAAMIVGRG